MLHTTSYTVQQNQTSCACCFYTNISALSHHTREPLHKSCIRAPKIHHPRLGSSSLLGVGVRVGESGWEGWWGEIMRWDFFSFFFFKALCLSRGWVISGGRAEVWRSQPWILVTGCWWSLPASLGTPRLEIYSQRCRSRNSADRRPSGENARGGDIRTWLT